MIALELGISAKTVRRHVDQVHLKLGISNRTAAVTEARAGGLTGPTAVRRHNLVYSDVMGRTQIYLGDDERELLDRVSRATGASRSELIRRAVRNTFGERTKAERLRALEASAGSWSGRRPSGADYVDAVRGDLNERLRRLGVE